MKEAGEANEHAKRDLVSSFFQTQFQDTFSLETLKTGDFDNFEEWKERAFKREILRIFIYYYCVRHQTPLKEAMKDIEKTILLSVLVHFNGNQKKAAKFLKTKVTTLNEKVKRYNIRFQKMPE